MTTLTLQCTNEDQVTFQGDFSGGVNIPEADGGIFLALSDGTILGVGLDERDTWALEILHLGPGTRPGPGTKLDRHAPARLTLWNPATPFLWAVLGVDLVAADRALMEGGSLRV